MSASFRRRLSNFLYIRVRISCGTCRRAANLSLARLAEKFGAETDLQTVLDGVAADCPWRGGKGYGKHHSPCLAKYTDLDSTSPPLPDLPSAMMRLRVIEDGQGRDIA